MDARVEWAKRIAAKVDRPELEEPALIWLEGLADRDVPELAAGLIAGVMKKTTPHNFLKAALRDGWAMEVATDNRVRGQQTLGFSKALDDLCRDFGDPATLSPNEKARRLRAVAHFWADTLPRIAHGTHGKLGEFTETMTPFTPVRLWEDNWWTLDEPPINLGKVQTYAFPYYPGLEAQAYRLDMERNPEDWAGKVGPQPTEIRTL
jgi:hypothetical protein